VMGVIWSFGTMVLLGQKITLLTALIPPLIVVIGIPNCIYFLNKYHTSYKATNHKQEAIEQMVGRMGVVTLFCNITAAIGFFVFAFTKSPLLKEFGWVSGLNIMALFLISLLFIPPVLTYLPPPSTKHVKYLENKFLDGDARIEELLRYKGLHNSKWKIAELEQKNDELFQTVLMLERRAERAEEPLKQAHDQITQLETELSQIKGEYEQLEQNQLLSNQKIKQLELTINSLKNEKQALEKQFAEKESLVIHQDQEKIEQLTQERQKFLQERNQLHMLSKRLKSDLSNSEHQLSEVSNLLHESRNNAKQKDLWRVLALSFGCLAVIFFLIFIFL